MALRHTYPVTWQLVHGAFASITLNVRDAQGNENAKRYFDFRTNLIKPGAQLSLLFTRAGDSPANAVHTIAATANVNSNYSGIITARWEKVDIPHGQYDMWTVIHFPGETNIFFRKDKAEVI